MSLITCYRCRARYLPGDWALFRPEPGTTGRVHYARAIPDVHRPTCLKPPLLTPPIEPGCM